MTGVDELDLDVARDRNRAVVADRLQQRDRAKRVRLGVQRQGGGVLRVAVPVRVFGILFLNPAGVGKDDAAEILGAGRTEHPAPESLRRQSRKVAAVVQMGMRQDDGIDFAGRHRQILPVALAQFLEPLEQAGVDQHSRRARVEQVFRSRDGPRRPEEGD